MVALGDWLNYGENAYGEMYSQVMDETGFSLQTLTNDKYVASKIEIYRRREILSWSHHEAELAEWINTGHVAIKMAVRRLAIHVAQVGAWLVAAKDKCKHGEWLPWLGEYCPEISQDTSERYRKVYLRYSAEMRNMTTMQAYRHLGIVKDPTDPEPVVTPPLPEGKYRCVVIDPP